MKDILTFLKARFDYVQVLGEGGICRVFRAMDRKLRRPTAIKVLLPASREDPELRLRFVREMKLLERWNHPNLIEVYDTALEPFPWYSMRLLAGFSLEEHLARMGPLPLSESLSIVLDVLSALHYIHKDGFLHRDIKPANILLDEEGRAYLADLGLAGQAISSGLTRDGVVMGTPYYMPPEHLADGSYDKTGDLFSVGLLFAECLSGQRYYRLVGAPLFREPRQELRLMLGDLAPPEVMGILEVMLAEDPRDRFASAQSISRLIKQELSKVRQRERFEALQELVTLDLVTLGPLHESLRLLCRLTPELRQDYLEDLSALRSLQLHCWEIDRRTARFEGLDDENSVVGVDAWKVMASALGERLHTLLWEQDLTCAERVTEAVQLTTLALRRSLGWARVDPLEHCLAPLLEGLPVNLKVILPDKEVALYGYQDLEAIRTRIREVVGLALRTCAPDSIPVSLFLQHRTQDLHWILEIKGRDLKVGASEVGEVLKSFAVEVEDLDHGGIALQWSALLRCD
jgi:serine/threonine protein kinase